ncbi:ClpP/crotonase-like domain-containing protein [Aspergillus ambiguus]|uniref:enoyl-CoA hydratase/isomerase family protein n=1 Tax=Aspergillus ambiguus TaxID=176160 RepID=UPI003CCCE59D
MPQFQTPPPKTTRYALSFPSPGILLVTITREKRMNSIDTQGHWEGEALWSWFDDEPSMRVAVITGAGAKAFSAGADLLEQHDRAQSADDDKEKVAKPVGMPPSGFAGISRRRGKKPIIAAVNGFALGGGFEICLNCDIIVASPKASFALPEVERGLYAAAGGLARIVREVGMHVGSELALTGRRLSAKEALDLRLVNVIAQAPETLLEEAMKMARKIASLSPDAVIVTRDGLRETWESGSVEQASRLTDGRYLRALMQSENLKIGLAAFAMKKEPKWVDSKL